jgi:hypothetical protein
MNSAECDDRSAELLHSLQVALDSCIILQQLTRSFSGLGQAPEVSGAPTWVQQVGAAWHCIVEAQCYPDSITSLAKYSCSVACALHEQQVQFSIVTDKQVAMSCS